MDLTRPSGHYPMQNDCTISEPARLEDIGPDAWNALAAACPDATCFQAYEWIAAWWQVFGAGRELRLYAVRRGDELCGLAPMYLEAGMLRFVGEGHSDYNVFLWHAQDPAVVELLLDMLLQHRSSKVIEFAEVPETSALAQALHQRSDPRLRRHESTPCPRLTRTEASINNALGKKSIKRNRNKLARQGTLAVEHLDNAKDILPCLETFYRYHIDRWSNTDYPSLFLNPDNRSFYEALVHSALPIVFTVIRVDGHLVAAHFGMRSAGWLIWYKPAFDTGLANCSPGEVLLASLIEYVSDNAMVGLDFTRGEEAFKLRYCTEIRYNLNYAHHRHPPYLQDGKRALKQGIKRLLRLVRLRP